MKNKPDIYLEISPRGTGKTYRLIGAVVSWVRSGTNRIAVIHTPNERMYRNILKDPRLDQWMHRWIFRSSESKGLDKTFEPKHFYDDFDWIGGLELNDDSSGYYTTSAAKIRTLEEMSDKNTKDPLVKLVQLCGGQYVSVIPFSGNVYPKILAEIRSLPCFPTEYLNHFIS